VPLNAVGRVQAEEAGRRLRALVPDPAALDYVASPLGRTRETMEILRAALGLVPTEYRLDSGLKELTFGRWEGLTWREVRARDAAGATRRERDKWNFVPPEGESYAMLATRVVPLLAGITRDTVVVSHGGVARALLATQAGVAEHEAPRIDIWQGKVLVVEAGAYRWA
jgi:broad specificity phosphatase PhoE